MLEAMLTHLHNWFPARNGKHAGAFVIASGALSPDAISEETLLSRFGAAHIDHIGPIMPGEDFYAFLDGRPGFFVELGSRCPEKGCDMPHHNPKYRLDQDALPYGVQYLFDMALTLLDGTGKIASAKNEK